MDIVERLIVTRARIEAAVTGPCVLAVTSALTSDGSAILASALAESLIFAGHSVLFLPNAELSNANGFSQGERAHQGDLRYDVQDDRKQEPATLGASMSRRDSHSVDSVKAAFEIYRRSYEYTIVDTSVALASGSALAFTRAADFVLIAFEEGRGARHADRELARTLHATGTSLLGVVTLERKTIRWFGTKSAVAAPAVRPGTQLGDTPKRGPALSSTVR